MYTCKHVYICFTCIYIYISIYIYICSILTEQNARSDQSSSLFSYYIHMCSAKLDGVGGWSSTFRQKAELFNKRSMSTGAIWQIRSCNICMNITSSNICMNLMASNIRESITASDICIYIWINITAVDVGKVWQWLNTNLSKDPPIKQT